MILPLLLAGGALLYFATRKTTGVPGGAGLGQLPGAGNLTTVQGKSGAVYGVGLSQVPAPVGPNVKVMDVYLVPNGTKVMTYAQQGSDTNARSFVASPLAMTDPILIAARSDFGV